MKVILIIADTFRRDHVLVPTETTGFIHPIWIAGPRRPWSKLILSRVWKDLLRNISNSVQSDT